ARDIVDDLIWFLRVLRQIEVGDGAFVVRSCVDDLLTAILVRFRRLGHLGIQRGLVVAVMTEPRFKTCFAGGGVNRLRFVINETHFSLALLIGARGENAAEPDFVRGVKARKPSITSETVNGVAPRTALRGEIVSPFIHAPFS